MTPEECAVVVCTHDRPESLAQCLASVRRMARQPGDLIVVDNDPSDSRAADVAQSYNASYHVETVRGVPHARNLGLAVAERPVVAYLDDDSVADNGWIEALVGPFANPNVGGVAGVLGSSDSPSAAARLAQQVNPMEGFWETELRLSRGDADWFRIVNFGGFVFGSNMAVRRSAALEVGGFHPALGRGGAPICGGNEQYMFFRLLAAGWSAVVTPAALVLHPYPESLEAVVAGYLQGQESLAGYTLFLLARHPRHAGHLLGRVARASARLVLPTRVSTGLPEWPGPSRSARVGAWGRGVKGALKALIR